jgi:hypothetical protein
MTADHRQIPLYVHGRWIAVDCKIAHLVRLVNQIPGIASRFSCQGGSHRKREFPFSSVSEAYLSLSTREDVWHDFEEFLYRGARRHFWAWRGAKPRLSEITHRLQSKFEQRLKKPLAVTYARDPWKSWRRNRIPELYPRLWLRGYESAFYWDAKDSPMMLASVTELLQEESAKSG